MTCHIFYWGKLHFGKSYANDNLSCILAEKFAIPTMYVAILDLSLNRSVPVYFAMIPEFIKFVKLFPYNAYICSLMCTLYVDKFFFD